LFGLCKFMWVIDLLIILLNPNPETLTHPSTPKVLQAKGRASTLFPSIVVTFGLIVESIKEFEGASHSPIVLFIFIFFTPRWLISMSSHESSFCYVCGGNLLSSKIEGWEWLPITWCPTSPHNLHLDDGVCPMYFLYIYIYLILNHFSFKKLIVPWERGIDFDVHDLSWWM